MKKCSLCGIVGHYKNNKKYHQEINAFNKIAFNKIAFNKIAFNKNGRKKLNSMALKNEDNFINEFNNNEIYKNQILNELHLNKTDKWTAKKCNKINNYTVKHTEDWTKLKIGTKERGSSPKTDIVIHNENTKDNVTVSIKSGCGRPTSADGYETKAIFESIINENKQYRENYELYYKVKKLIECMLKEKLEKSNLNMTEMKNKFLSTGCVGFDKEFEWYNKFNNSKKECNLIWKEIITKYPDFKLDIIKECLTGNNKFKTNIGKASYLINLKSSTSTEIIGIIDLSNSNKDLDNYCEKLGTSNPFACKSSGSTLWMRFL